MIGIKNGIVRQDIPVVRNVAVCRHKLSVSFLFLTVSIIILMYVSWNFRFANLNYEYKWFFNIVFHLN